MSDIAIQIAVSEIDFFRSEIAALQRENEEMAAALEEAADAARYDAAQHIRDVAWQCDLSEPERAAYAHAADLVTSLIGTGTAAALRARGEAKGGRGDG